jgi:hypothetical protein
MNSPAGGDFSQPDSETGGEKCRKSLGTEAELVTPARIKLNHWQRARKEKKKPNKSGYQGGVGNANLRLSDRTIREKQGKKGEKNA